MNVIVLSIKKLSGLTGAPAFFRELGGYLQMNPKVNDVYDFMLIDGSLDPRVGAQQNRRKELNGMMNIIASTILNYLGPNLRKKVLESEEWQTAINPNTMENYAVVQTIWDVLIRFHQYMKTMDDVIEEWDQMRQQPGEEVPDYGMRFSDMVQVMKVIGHHQTEEFQKLKFIKGLNDSEVTKNVKGDPDQRDANLSRLMEIAEYHESYNKKDRMSKLISRFGKKRVLATSVEEKEEESEPEDDTAVG